MSKKPMTRLLVILSGLASGSLVALQANGAVIIPDKAGFSGFINLGLAGMSIESNLLAGVSFVGADLGSARIDSLDQSPDDETAILPTANFELSYTFEKSRTQIYIGNLLEDFLRFDMSSVAGIRHSIGKAGIVGATLRRTSLETEVWEDPFIVGAKRRETDQTFQGAGIFWQQILGTGLELEYTTAEIDVDDERSGQALGLSADEQALLDRNGDINRLAFRYEINWANRQHILTPGITFGENDRDGDAVSHDTTSMSLNYIYTPSARWSHVFNVTYADLDYDARNPVYGRKDSADRFGASFSSFYHQPFDWKQWSANFTLGWFDEDHDIDFYDTSVRVISVGMLRRF